MPPKASRVSDVLAEVFKRTGMKRSIRRAEAVLLWPQVVGPDVARFTEAKSLQDGILFIEVSDSETAMHLSYQRQKFIHVYEARFGIRDVQDLRFRVGRRSEAEKTPEARRELPVDPKALAEIARGLSELNLPESLAQPTMKAARAMLAHRARCVALGYRPCLTCETLFDGEGLCEVCRRYATTPKVQTASSTLAVNPAALTPALSEEERAVATHLAQDYLRERLLELLPQVLAEPAFKPQLEHAARCLLAHQLGKPLRDITEADLDRIDSRVARALGRWG